MNGAIDERFIGRDMAPGASAGFRLEALWNAAAIDGEAGNRALAHHPFIRGWPVRSIEPTRDAARSLRRLLVSELVSLESNLVGPSEIGLDTDEMSAAEYFVRRRWLTRVLAMKYAAERLPRLWTMLAAMPAADIVRRCLDIGLDALALSIRGMDRDRLALMLAPLGRDVALAVLDRRRSMKLEERPALEAAVRGALDAAKESRERANLAAFIGRRCLATLHRGLAPLVGDEFARLCRSNLAAKLARTPPVPASPGDRAWIEMIVKQRVLSLLGEASSAGGAP